MASGLTRLDAQLESQRQINANSPAHAFPFDQSSSQIMNLDHLPPELLSIILNCDTISLQERIQLRAVSLRWKSLIEVGLRKQTKLVLRSHIWPTIHSPDDLLHLKSEQFSVELAQLLARLFPAVVDLTLDVRHLEQLELFFLHCQFTLKSLILRCENQNAKQSIMQQVAAAINSLANLTSLELDVNELCFSPCSALQQRASLLSHLTPTLARLERFSYPQKSQFWPGTFEHLGSRCTHLELNAAHLWNSQIKFASSLTHLVVTDATAWTVADIVSKFASLQSLRGQFNWILLTTDMLRQLSSLEHLSELHLLELAFWRKQLSAPLLTDQSLNNVKKLHLQIVGSIADVSNFCASLSAWFPRLEQLTIESNRDFCAAIKANRHHLTMNPGIVRTVIC